MPVARVLLCYLLRTGVWAPGPRPYLDVHDARLGEVAGQVLHHEELLHLTVILGLLANSMELGNKINENFHRWIC